MWRFSESVPGLRWTYWDPTGYAEAIPVKSKIYRTPLERVLYGTAIISLFALFTWVLFNPVFAGIVGILGIAFVPLHFITLPLGQKRKVQGRGYVLVEAGKAALTTGNVVWLNPELSRRRTRSKRKLLVKTATDIRLIEFTDKDEALHGLRLLRKTSNQHKAELISLN